jgi:GT2 family glycosyltransferase
VTAAEPRVAVVVATHEYCYPLERCLAGFAAQTESPADVILVDNGSAGAVSAWAREHAPTVTTIVRESNGFFCGGYNEGLRHAIALGYDFVLIVNADTEMVFLREPGNVQNTVLTFPSFTRNLLSFVRHKLLGGEAPASDEREREVEFLNGVCVLCRTAALREIGLLDETMGGYVEDTDWAWRARCLGWSSVYAPVRSIVHHQPEVGYEHYATKCFMLRRNTIYWHRKRGAKLERPAARLGPLRPRQNPPPPRLRPFRGLRPPIGRGRSQDPPGRADRRLVRPPAHTSMTPQVASSKA